MYIQKYSWYFLLQKPNFFNDCICLWSEHMFSNFCLTFEGLLFSIYLAVTRYFRILRHIFLVWDACLFIVICSLCLQCTVLESNWQHKRGEAYSGTISIYMHPAIATTMNRVMPTYFICTRRHQCQIIFIVFLPLCNKCTYLSDVNTECCHSLMSHDIYAISRSDKFLKL